MPSNMHRRRARPDPVSCQSCRSKKLKCNRVQPCSNCSARSIGCNYIVPPPRQTEAATPPHSIPELVGRIERLESIVLHQAQVETGSERVSGSLYTTPPEFTFATSDVVSNVHQVWDKESQSLENIGTREDSLVCDPDLLLVLESDRGSFLVCLVA